MIATGELSSLYLNFLLSFCKLQEEIYHNLILNSFYAILLSYTM